MTDNNVAVVKFCGAPLADSFSRRAGIDCKNQVTVTRNGRGYCGLHDPERPDKLAAQKKRDEARNAHSKVVGARYDAWTQLQKVRDALAKLDEGPIGEVSNETLVLAGVWPGTELPAFKQLYNIIPKDKLDALRKACE